MDNDNASDTHMDNIDNLFDSVIDKLYIHVGKESNKLSNEDIKKLVSTFIVKFTKSNLTNQIPAIKTLLIEMIEQYSLFYILTYVAPRVKDFTQFVLSFKKDSVFNSI